MVCRCQDIHAILNEFEKAVERLYVLLELAEEKNAVEESSEDDEEETESESSVSEEELQEELQKADGPGQI